jgi:hypothetical protein
MSFEFTWEDRCVAATRVHANTNKACRINSPASLFFFGKLGWILVFLLIFRVSLDFVDADAQNNSCFSKVEGMLERSNNRRQWCTNINLS